MQKPICRVRNRRRRQCNHWWQVGIYQWDELILTVYIEMTLLWKDLEIEEKNSFKNVAISNLVYILRFPLTLANSFPIHPFIRNFSHALNQTGWYFTCRKWHGKNCKIIEGNCYSIVCFQFLWCLLIDAILLPRSNLIPCVMLWCNQQSKWFYVHIRANYTYRSFHTFEFFRPFCVDACFKFLIV